MCERIGDKNILVPPSRGKLFIINFCKGPVCGLTIWEGSTVCVRAMGQDLSNNINVAIIQIIEPGPLLAF